LSDDAEFVQEYNKIVQPLIEILNEQEKEEKKENHDFLCNQSAWNPTFEKKCEKQKDEYISENKFFFYIDPEEFVKQIQLAKVDQIYNFMDGVEAVYNLADLSGFQSSDADNINRILENIDIEKISQGKITKKMAVKNLQSRLQDYRDWMGMEALI
jgi:hypothetical protein